MYSSQLVNSEGFIDGELLGSDDGAFVGIIDGNAEGDELGSPVGCVDGDTEGGIVEGADDGDELGIPEGTPVGELVGSPGKHSLLPASLFWYQQHSAISHVSKSFRPDKQSVT